ncbi:MAG: alfa-L-rhamnosidase [Clostridiales bacterium]|nr:alfa-L-rhamnosidase [Clostridiales bacterium]
MEIFKSANWITCALANEGSAIAFYRNLSFSGKVKMADLYVSAVGVYDLFINGKKIDENYMKPGFTSYKNRLQYQHFSVAEHLNGNAEIRIEAGAGWAVGHHMHQINGVSPKNLFSKEIAVIATLTGEYEDGRTFVFQTDGDWNARSTEVLFSDIYEGETVDFTKPVVEYGKAQITQIQTNLVAQIGEGVVENERLTPIAVITTPKGETVLDFGQNLTGVVEMVVKGKEGDKISFSCAEVLDKDGNFYNDNYRSAKNQMTYVVDGNLRTLKPKFSFQGFRYIRLDEKPEDFFEKLQSVCAIVLHTKMKRTGYFVCGNEKINQLYHNIIWGQKSNYLDIPTDCPQRDERLGWTGDAQVFCRTASYNFDVRNFFKKWLGDVRLEQTEDGEVLGVVPQLIDRKLFSTRISAGWGDCITIIPYELYRVYGDKSFLSENFDAMQKWVEYIRRTGDNEYLWLTGYHYGDWLAMDEGMEDSYVGATSNDLVASAFYAYSVELLVKAGKALGKDMREYEQLRQNIKKEFCAYFMPEGELLEEYPYTEKIPKGKKSGCDAVRKGLTQTAVTLILQFALYKDETQKTALAKKLDELIEANGGKMTTGFLGTPYLLHALTETGYVKRAYDVFFREDNPSWLYSVNHGATTMWEHWNGIKEDGSFWSTDMNSFNHYAYGAVGDWMYETVAGIKIKEGGEGFEKIYLAPHPDKRLGFVDCSIDSVKGKIESKWRYIDDGIKFEFNVPYGVDAEIRLPDGQSERVTGGNYTYFVKN